jgi:hypothetical protein
VWSVFIASGTVIGLKCKEETSKVQTIFTFFCKVQTLLSTHENYSWPWEWSRKEKSAR